MIFIALESPNANISNKQTACITPTAYHRHYEFRYKGDLVPVALHARGDPKVRTLPLPNSYMQII